ncbi:uncharacterized protein G2W53_031387 [Senna tora]|uniref:Uncharacterized protein n=1 Tax=Senna tora TaxID=362788 RepID=A0A834T804_9FABA|nr:uncharacterized protein G2W53_031387 [Senna tora]
MKKTFEYAQGRTTVQALPGQTRGLSTLH